MYSSPFTCSEPIVNSSGVRRRHVTVDPSPKHHPVPFLWHMANTRSIKEDTQRGTTGTGEQEDRGRRDYQTHSHPSLLRLPYKNRSFSIIFLFLTRGK